MYDTSSICPGCPYETYRSFFHYYGQHGWADAFVTAAFEQTSVTFGGAASGTIGSQAETLLTSYTKTADFSTFTNYESRRESIKKGTAYMHVWMYVIREFEDAIDDCQVGSLNNNYGSVHAWDEGVAFYVGSKEGTSVATGIANSGVMVHALAKKRCGNFDTCNSAGEAKVNANLLDLFQQGRNLLMNLDCTAVRPVVDAIVAQMTVPLVQGTLRYAYKVNKFGPGGSNTSAAGSDKLYKESAEGATFAFAVLPLLAKCSETAAKSVYENMNLAVSATANMDAVKKAFEANYACLGITCADVGYLTSSGGCVEGDSWCTQCDTSTSVTYEKIAGYTPRSKVTDHNAIDLDQDALATQLSLKTAAGFTAAKAIYTQGGNSKSYAEFTVPALTVAFTAGEAVIGRSATGSTVYGSVKSAAAVGDTTLQVTYDTTLVQATYNGLCQVGGLVTTTTKGCFDATKDIVVGYETVNPSAVVNKNGRTLQGFATVATTTAKMWSGCPNCPYEDFSKFYTYYGDLDYADKYVTAALDGTVADFANLGDMDYSSTTQGTSYYGRVDATKKGTAYMNNLMYVIREFEDAIDDCQTSSIDNNYGSAHAWDEGVAFYTGSLEGTIVGGNSAGEMNYRLAEKRCENYDTCGPLGNAATGVSKVNTDLFAKFAEAQEYLFMGTCDLVRPVLREIVPLMIIPLVQGVLRYAYKLSIDTDVAQEDNRLKMEGEGATFAAAMLPWLHACSAADAATVLSNMKPGASMSMDKDAVKAALERNYICMGFTCADIGALNVASGGCNTADIGGWCSVCTDPSPPPPPPLPNVTVTVTEEKEKETLSAGAIAGIAVAAVVALLFFICLIVLIMKEKKGQPVFANIEGGSSTTKGPPA
jgi:hypothetical protein